MSNPSPRPSPHPALTPRLAEVLREVVDAYLRSGEPVGSQLVAEHSAGQMSSATARVVLSELADHGLLTQPHTSAGRVPTHRGLRVYVDALMRPRPPSARAREAVDTALREAGRSPHEIVRAASDHLARACEQAAVSRAPRIETLHIHGLSLVSVRPGQTLAVVLFDDGTVRHRMIDADLTASELQRVQNLFAAELTGLTLAAARTRLHGDLGPGEAGGVDGRTRELTAQALPDGEAADDVVYVCGRTHIVDHGPSPESLGDMLRVLDDKRLLLRVLDDLTANDGVQVRLGDDASSLGLAICGVVAAPYFVGQAPGGTVAIVGPVRMEYARVIPLVTYTARAISGILRGALDAA